MELVALQYYSQYAHTKLPMINYATPPTQTWSTYMEVSLVATLHVCYYYFTDAFSGHICYYL